MIKVSHATLIFLAGFVWLAVGCFLLPLGLNFIVETLLSENVDKPHPLLNFLSSYAGSLDSAALILIAFGLLLGYFKGKRVFSKSVNKNVERILALPNPASLSKMYSPAYFLLIALMVLLGALLRYFPQDVRGVVDVAVGAALINGAALFFRNAWQVLKGIKTMKKT